MMESVRAYYEYPPSHANMPAKDYGGSVTPAKARRSWGDLLRFRSRTKEHHLAPVAANLAPPTMPAQPTHSYMAEYRQKYGVHNGTVGRASYQAMTVVKSISPPPLPSNNMRKGYPHHGYPANGYTNRGSSSGTVSAATSATMSSTVRYMDWFGSVVGRRPPARTPLPAFTQVPPAALHATDKGAAWDHYVTLDPVYEAPQVVPVQLYTNVCVCPDQMLNTRGRKKKKCKRCGRKVATVRHATTGVATKVRPAIPASMYQPPPQHPPPAAQHAWGWQVLEERVYERYEVRARHNDHSPAHTLTDEESPPPTPETVRSVRSLKSIKSSDSSATITRDAPEPTRPAPPPPTVPRTLPATPETPTAAISTRSAKDDPTLSETGEKRGSILLENPTAYQLISRYSQSGTHIGSDTDELSDNAVDNCDAWDTKLSPATTDDAQEGQVNVITVGDTLSQSVAVTNSPKMVSGREMGSKLRIHTHSNEATYSLNDQSSSDKDIVSNYHNGTAANTSYNSSSSDNYHNGTAASPSYNTSSSDNLPNTFSSSRSASSSTKSSSKSVVSSGKNTSPNNKTVLSSGKNTSPNNKSVLSSGKHFSTNSKTDLYDNTGGVSKSKRNSSGIKNSLSTSDSALTSNHNSSFMSEMTSFSSKNNVVKKITPPSSKKVVVNGHSNPTVNGNSSGPRLEVKKLREASELQLGGNTVRIAGQRMLVLTPGGPLSESYTGFSSGEEENEVSVEDDTSDYPMSSPTTTRDSDTDTLLEEEDLPFDSSRLMCDFSGSHHELPSLNSDDLSDTLTDSPNEQCERWIPARDTIYEEEENEAEGQMEKNCKGEIQDEGDESPIPGDEDEKDDPSMSSSPTNSPVRQEGLHPTLSELLKVKSILKKPPSVDTSSETDSDFYLPTFSEFKQNQRKKKQVQFRSSHEVTVIEDAGESKGRKVSSARSPRREREKAKEKQKNNYNLINDLQDIYSRNGDSKVYRTNIKDDFSDVRFNHEQTVSDECESEYNKIPLSVDGSRLTEAELEERGQDCVSGEICNNDKGAFIEITDEGEWSLDQKQDAYTRRARDQEGLSLHRSLYDRQTSDESTPDTQDAFHISTRLPPPTGFNNSSLFPSTPTRQAPPPPRNRALSPTRPNVPPPPPPTTRPSSSGVAPPKMSPPQRPLPSPPALPLSPPPDSPPPSPPPPPLPTSPPPALEETDQMAAINHTSQDTPLPQSPTFHSFKAKSGCLNPPLNISPSLTLPASSSETSRSTECLREVLPSPGCFPVFGADEETRTATIRGRGAAHARPSIKDAFTTGVSASTSSASTPPVAPQRRNRNRSLSPEANDSAIKSGIRIPGGRVRRSSFLNSLVGEENPYEQITDHIYEELLSHSPSRTSTFTHYGSPTRNNTPHKSPSPGKSMFEGASKNEILEYLQDARRRVANTVDDDEDDTLQGMVDVPLEAEMDLEDEEEDQLGVDPPEDHFTALTSRNRGNRSSNMSSNSDSSENSGLLRSDKERLAAGEVERTDSGVGSETSKPSVAVRRGQRSAGGAIATREGDIPLCDDCDAPVDTHITNSGVVYAPLVCRRCSRRRQERKEILTEIMETEIKYGRDLRVMVDEFYRPILVAGLLTRDQLRGIFLNVEELVVQNRVFSLQLRDALEIALDQGDEDLLTVNVAKLFLNAVPMLHAFENYCVKQGSASLLLQTLEKEKELLRIFLKVSQMENTLLRRMNLHSFLMVPVQRVTKYPLLLARLYKATPPTHPSREDCRRAKEKIELHLQHMNNETKEVSPTKLWRRFSMSVGSGAPLKRSPQPHDFTINLKLRKLALEVLEWSLEEATVVREGRLFCLAPDFNNWTRRGRSLKMASVHVLLVTHGSPRAVFEDEVPEDGLVTPRSLGIKDAAILAFKDHKVSKAALIRHEPWLLSRCVVAWESEGETECFEVTDLNSKDTYIFKGSDSTSTEAWFRYIQFHALSVGMWKRRRPALANIMINGMNRS